MIYLLSPHPHEGTIHLPMISFSLLSQTLELDAYDLLIFTSKQAVRSANDLNKNWKNIPCIAIGNATATEIESLGGTVYYKPKNFYTKTLSTDVKTKFKNKKLIYLRPKDVFFDLKGSLANNDVFIDEKMIYNTSCIAYKKHEKPPCNAIIIFTSPSTIKCFLRNFSWNHSYIAIVIGESTKKHLPLNARYEIADKPLIKECILKAEQVLLTSNSK
jgi:uroporphyrinogen-III synthase